MATDFFERQEDAHRQTGRLLALFILAVIAIVAAVYLTATLIMVFGTRGHSAAAPPIFDLGRLVLVATFVLIVILAGSLYKIATLQEGGEAVARLLGGELVAPGTTDLAERRLLNVVEEMAIASGTPVPNVYVLANEPGINAFAAGFDPGSAVIAVSQGALNHLTRDELQGVIGHEFSHILNGDMRLNLRLIGLLHGILLIALIGYAILRLTEGSSRSSSDKKDSSGGLVVFGIGLLAIGYIGLFFGRLIKAAVSRQREFLADASSVQFTRNPQGIVGALKKIGGLREGSQVASPNAEQACHMFFGQGVSAWAEALATHPPLDVRIRRLDPSFDGVFPEIASDEVIDPDEADEITFEDDTGRRADFLRKAVTSAVAADTAVASVGAPTEEHIAYASTLLASLPEPLVAAAREPFGARTVVYALLIDPDESVRRVQFQHLDSFAWPGTTAEVQRLLPYVEPLGPETFIPLVDLSLPALRQLSPSQYASFRSNINPLAGADRRVSLFEFALERVLLRHLDQYFQRRPPTKVRFDALPPLLDACALVLSALARVGHEHDGEIARAYQHGLQTLGAPGNRPLRRPEECTLSAVGQALDNLAAASPRLKKRILDACSACIATDGVVSLAEGELLRAIADSLDCPMPPLLGATGGAASPRR